MKLAVLAIVGACAIAALALDNGLGRRPQMGWNSWYDVMDQLNEDYVRQTADALVETGLAQLGYRYVNLDDCWAGGRYPNGTLYADTSRFPSGTLKAAADYVHSKGLLFGTYTDRGTKTCAGLPGAQGYEVLDAQTYASWGVDYLKEDSCYASQDHDTAFQQYGLMRDALNATGRPIFFALCGWNDWYAPVGFSLGNSWRIGPDDTNWPGVLSNIDINSQLSQYAGAGGWNDPCLLLAEIYTGELRMTHNQTRTQFNMWAIMSSPLLISANVRNMSAFNFETYSNEEVIAIDQDPLGKQGIRIFGGDLAPSGSGNAPAVVGVCNPSDPNQLWRVNDPAESYLHNPAADLCLNVDDCGTDLIYFECVTTGVTCSDNFANMKFQVTAQNTLQSLEKPGLCATVTSLGSQINLEPCSQGPVPDNQYWSYNSTSLLLSNGKAGQACLTTNTGNGVNIWIRELDNNEWAMVFINAGTSTVQMTCDQSCFSMMGFAAGQSVAVRDVWQHVTSIIPAGSLTMSVPGDGFSFMFRLKAA